MSGEGQVGRLTLLGRDYGQYGSYAATSVGKGAVAISVGADPSSPSLQFKDDRSAPNEDALCIIEAGDWAGYAVADAHFGPEASHLLIERLDALWASVRPESLEHLRQMVGHLRNGEPAQTESESTLLAVVYDRTQQRGYGISYGDSSFVTVSAYGAITTHNHRDARYVRTTDRSLLGPASAFRFDAAEGTTMLAFTDGIDECHYRKPSTSVRPHHIVDIVTSHGPEPRAIVDALTHRALVGVDGNPGGQDNIALIVATA